MKTRETKFAVMDSQLHIYNTFPTRAEAVAYLNSGRSWVKGCSVAKIIIEHPSNPSPTGGATAREAA